MSDPTHPDAAVGFDGMTRSTGTGSVTAEVFAGETHLAGDPAAAFDVDVAPNTHYPNEVELRVGVGGLEVLVGLDEAAVRQLRDVLGETLAPTDTEEGRDNE